MHAYDSIDAADQSAVDYDYSPGIRAWSPLPNQTPILPAKVCGVQYMPGSAVNVWAWQVIVMVPGYQSLSEVAKAMGCSIKAWNPVSQADSSLTFDLESLAELISTRTKVKCAQFQSGRSSLMSTAACNLHPQVVVKML